MSRLPHIVSTRKLTSELVDGLRIKGWTFSDHDFISKVIDIPSNLNERDVSKCVVLTSITGVNAFVQLAGQLNVPVSDYYVYCISGATRKYANALGLTIKATAPNASALAKEIAKDADVKKITHICSNIRRDELTSLLSNSNIFINDVIAYRTEFTPVAVDQPYDAVVFFSPSAVDSFLMVNELRQVPAFCIGDTTASHAKQKGYLQTYIPEAPSEEILLQTIIEHYSKTPAHVKE